MRITRLLKCCILTLITAGGAGAQSINRYNTFSYNVNEGLLQSTMADIEFDNNNFLWISFPNGIQKFDGNSFTTVASQPGLPDDKNVSFLRDHNGNLFISHSKGLSKYNINGNRFILVFKQSPVFVKPAMFIGEDDNIIYMYDEDGNINGMDARSLKIISTVKTGFPSFGANQDNRPAFCDNIINHKTAFWIGQVVHLWDLKNRKLVSSSATLQDRSLFFLKLRSENEVLYYDYKVNTAIQCWNFVTNTNTILYVKGKDAITSSRCIIYPWKDKMLISFNNKLYETDSSLQVLRSELVNFQNQPLAGNASINKIKEDRFGNLCIQTVTGGIRKIIRNNYAIKYYGTEKRDECHSLSVFADKKNNRVFAGTPANGLIIFDTLQRLVKHIRFLPGTTRTFGVNTIVKHPGGDYLLFIPNEKQVWQLRQDLSSMRPIPFSTTLPPSKKGIDYFGKLIFKDEKEAVVQSQGKFYRIKFLNDNISEHLLFRADVLSGIRYKQDIVIHNNDKLVFVDAATFRERKRIPLENTGGVRCFATDNDNYIYIGSNKGIFKIDSTGRILYHWQKENGLPDDCIYAMVIDDKGYLWCSTNKGILKINRDKSILQLKKEDGLQENEFNTNAVFKAEDGEIFFAGVNGVSSFFPAGIRAFEENTDVLFTGIRANNEEIFKDTAVWNIKKIELPYYRNALSFDFIAIANNNPGQYIYQYMMKGVDKQWIQNNDMQTVRYQLQPGDYVFKVYASRQFDKDAKPMKEIHITINPPFWKTWWFLSGIGLLVIGLIAYSVNRYNKRKYEKKLAELESEHKIQLERERISRDLHDSIGAYANAVLYNTELLQKGEDSIERNDLMNDLKFASKDIITSLRETVWALKQDNHSAEECFLRIRNFVQSLARYYPHIQFLTEGEAPAGKQLQHSKALNVVRIVQEAVTNAIKHSEPGRIRITSGVKEGHWLLQVSNNGKGFNYEEIKKKEQGHGLENMQQRARDSAFDISIESTETEETTVSILV
ncbi:MAG: two-component regulator propeller domain-containing protein [Ferruginibacter sp.]